MRIRENHKLYKIHKNVLVHLRSDLVTYCIQDVAWLGKILAECRAAHPNHVAWYQLNHVRKYKYDNYIADVYVVYKPRHAQALKLPQIMMIQAVDDEQCQVVYGTPHDNEPRFFGTRTECEAFKSMWDNGDDITRNKLDRYVYDMKSLKLWSLVR